MTDNQSAFSTFIPMPTQPVDFNIVLFDDFETLDVFGPVEMIGMLPEKYRLGYYSPNGGIVENRHAVRIETKPFTTMDASGILLIPGGMGTRRLVDDEEFIQEIKRLAESSQHVLTVCTGSALLARAGLLDGKKATSNKRALDWACQNGPRVNWIRQARWVQDGKYFTSSGVSAGIDMILGFIADRQGLKTAQKIAARAEYVWNADPENDPIYQTVK